MARISVCMIVRNEEDVLERSLTCAAAFADEIVVVDTGSTDKTKEIAARFTDKLYDFEWIDDFAAARNFAFSKGTGDYLMWLDADDCLPQAEIQKIIDLKPTLGPHIPMIMCLYVTGTDEAGNPTFSYYRERIVRRDLGAKWTGAIHEVIIPVPGAIRSDIAVYHKKEKVADPDRNLRIFEKMIADGISLDPRQSYYYARELYYHFRYDDAAECFEAFLNEGKGWSENCIEATRLLAECHRRSERPEKVLPALFRGFTYDLPRAESLCAIADVYFSAGDYPRAVYWYRLATECDLSERSGGFVQADFYGYVPHLQLCVCYDRLGEYEKAEHHNELAGLIKPTSPKVIANRKYFLERTKNKD